MAHIDQLVVGTGEERRPLAGSGEGTSCRCGGAARAWLAARRPAQGLLLALAHVAALAVAPGAARADRLDRITLLGENDSFYFHSDKHYTQGLRFSDLRPDVAPGSAWNAPFDALAGLAPVFSGADGKRRYALFLGHSIFTPKNLALDPPDPRDRPYAGWAYLGTSLLQESGGRMLENVEIDLGAVGPGAFAEQVQNNWHQLLGTEPARGWGSQLRNEPGLMASYARLWRAPLIGNGVSGIDVVPQAGATVGNVMTYGDVGGMLRFGRSLQVDYGPVRIRPALSGTDYFDADRLDGRPGFYVFIGAQGRVVGRNIFLDGNTFESSAHVAKKTFVGDAQAGFSLFWSSRLRVDFSAVARSQEFVGQHGYDAIGTAALSFSW